VARPAELRASADHDHRPARTWYLYLLVPFDLRALRVLRLFRLFRLLKLLRYSPALLTLKRVIAHEYRALLGALLLMMMLMLFSAAIVYFLEREAQPDSW
jgi:voltage-gated potassium channel